MFLSGKRIIWTATTKRSISRESLVKCKYISPVLVQQVAPDRAALMGKLNQEMADMKEIQEADERWLRLLLGEPYEAKFQSEGTGSAIHVYDGNGEEILTYTAGVGWHEKESKAETEVHGAFKAVYYDAFRAARQEINAGAAGCMEAQGGFDARA